MPHVRVEDVLDLMDRAYDVACDDGAWVEGVTRACAPWLDTGEGVHGFAFDLGTGLPSHPTLVGGDESWQQSWRATWWDGFISHIAPDTLRALVTFAPISHTTELWAAVGAQIPTFEELLRQKWRRRRPAAAVEGIRYPDSLNVVALDNGGLGVALCANRSEVARRAVPKSTRWVVQRLAAHVTAGVRLRARLSRAQRTLVEGADAVADPSGKLLHVAPHAEVARAALRQAARDVVQARRARDDDPSHVLALWRALHADEFSVVETFDTDGRRFVVARSNRPGAPQLAKNSSGELLSERDRRVLAMFGHGCSNKLIAYQLDMSASAVAASLARARRVLGAATSAELVSAARRLESGARE